MSEDMLWNIGHMSGNMDYMSENVWSIIRYMFEDIQHMPGNVG